MLLPKPRIIFAAVVVFQLGCASAGGLQSDTARAKETCRDTFLTNLLLQRSKEEKRLVAECVARELRNIRRDRRELEREFEKAVSSDGA